MADQNDTVKKETLKVANPGRLQLTKTVESGKVKQNFTHGRSKSVTVEVRKTRTFTQGGSGMVEVKTMPGGAPMPTAADMMMQPDEDTMRHLTPEERASRLKALKTAEEEMKKATERAAQRREEEARQKALEAEQKSVEVP
ncbi:MAG: translation initiation factor IF-2, partial [Proteobacteria bacterium]|nr:translation initiation factor IF-2 [Pseudomonadota bacterium]